MHLYDWLHYIAWKGVLLITLWVYVVYKISQQSVVYKQVLKL